MLVKLYCKDYIVHEGIANAKQQREAAVFKQSNLSDIQSALWCPSFSETYLRLLSWLFSDATGVLDYGLSAFQGCEKLIPFFYVHRLQQKKKGEVKGESEKAAALKPQYEYRQSQYRRLSFNCRD